MTKWNGQYVSDALSITPDEGTLPQFKELLGLALRKNKKRAHLLVSTVLGKHIPVTPSVAVNAANTIVDRMWKHYTETGKQNPVTVFGYAETATCFGGLIAERINTYLPASYIHSTRYPVEGATEYGSFEESHSHATAHHITPTDRAILDTPENIIVLVDDELTTGNTIMNTIRLFESHSHHEDYYVATLTDLRTPESVKKFEQFQEEHGITITVFALLTTHLTIPENSVSIAEPIIEELKQRPEIENNLNGEVRLHYSETSLPATSVGLTSNQFRELDEKAQKVASVFSETLQGKTLVLGLEEDMFFSMKVASYLEDGREVEFSSSTRSPVITYDDSSYAIRDRIRYTVPDDEAPRYAYNIKNKYDQVIIITTEEQLSRNSELVDKLRKETSLVEILLTNTHALQKPLQGPDFGSYKPEDVSWLLKDLSEVELEAPLEEREEAIQSGGAHYAESLPVEYMPSDDYQELFKESLEQNKGRLAEAVGLVAEQIYELRNQAPVLVSLARAGTPVGVLIKRYLKEAHNYDAPHYAVSIVRGKGIDYNALRYIISHHNPEQVMFVDGWTGKGAITKELKNALDEFAARTGVVLNPELAVLADPGSCVTVYGTRDDYLIPSACLNSTVSGLVSRTVLNEQFIEETDYHGAKFYKEFSHADVSNEFVDTISALFTDTLISEVKETHARHETTEPDWSGWRMVEQVSVEYGINNVNLVKPGVGETTRVLLRRVPWRILIRPEEKVNLKHILLLAEQRGVEVEERSDLPYSVIGLIHPNFTKGATGFDGKRTE